MIVWGGKSSDDIRVVVERYPALPRPARKQEIIQVPGRNGDLVFQQEVFENYIQPYDVYLSAEANKLPPVSRAMAAWLYAPKGYQRLEDSYEPDFYRMAYYSGPADIENIMNRFGRATIEFSCKPQRFLRAGEFSVSLEAPGALYNAFGFDALPHITVHGNGSGVLSVGGVAVEIKELDEYLVLDSETQNAYKDTQNKNRSVSAPEFPVLRPGKNYIGWTGGIQRVEIIPRWWTL